MIPPVADDHGNSTGHTPGSGTHAPGQYSHSGPGPAYPPLRPAGRGSGPPTGAISVVRPPLPDALENIPDQVSWFVPGRIEVLGKHTDYAGGRSLLAAVDCGITFAASKIASNSINIEDTTASQHVQITSTSVSETVHLPLSITQEHRRGHWSAYPAAVISRLVANFGQEVPAAKISVSSTLPLASGMSSSSALVVGLARTLIDLGGIDRNRALRRHVWDMETLAGYLACVENGMSYGELTGHRGVGTFGGSEDHTAMLCCDADSLAEYSFCPVRRRRRVPFPVDHSFVVAVCGVLAEKTGAAREAYNRASLSTREIVTLWNEDTGRSDIYLSDAVRAYDGAVNRLRDIVSWSDYLRGRLDQFIIESEVIIPAAGDALMDGNLQRFGELVDESQHWAEVGLLNQVPQTVFLQRQARQIGAVAASSFGAGFGGSVWALVPTIQAQDFADEWQRVYLREYPYLEGAARMIITRPAGRARRLVNE